MHKDIVKGGLKVIIRRIKQQWGSFTDEQIAEIEGFCEEHEKKIKLQHLYHKEFAKSLKN